MGTVQAKPGRSDDKNQRSPQAPLASRETAKNSRDSTTSDKDYKPWKQWFPALEPAGPSAKPDPRRVLDIAFFHGLQVGYGRHAREKTWTNRDGCCWPRDWLPNTLKPDLQGKKMRVLGIEYNAQATEHRTGLFGVRANGHRRIAWALFQSLVNSKRCSLGMKPFVLVGHSYGGIVIKSLVVLCNDLSMTNRDGSQLSHLEIQAIDAATTFMENLKGYVFYGVPQRGSTLANYASWTNKFIPLCLGGSVCNDLVLFDMEILDLTTKFEAAIRGRGIIQFAFGETRKTGKVVKCMVVDRSSAKGNLHHTEFLELQGTNHKTVCKPKSEDGEAFQRFVDIMRDIIAREFEVINRVHGVPLIAPDATSQRVQSTFTRMRKKVESSIRSFFSYGSCKHNEDVHLPLITAAKKTS